MARRGRADEDFGYQPREGLIGPPSLLPHLFLWIVVIGGGLAAVHYFAGPAMFQKVLLALASPVGLAWLLLWLAAYWVTVWRIRLAALLTWTSWLVLTLGGNSYLSGRLIQRLEKPYAATDPLAIDELDAALVLGGGSDRAPAGAVQFSSFGDRIGLAARLYHAGKVKRIVVAGKRPEPLAAGELHYYEEAAQLLVGLGVPDDRLVRLAAGQDTAGELDALKEWLGQQGTPPSLGLITSAWHLRRAMRLAERRDLKLTPIAANFLGQPFRRDPHVLIPSARHLLATQLAVKEFLGLWLDR